MSGPARTDRCGTVSGYGDHLKLGTPTCQPCRDVVAQAEVDYRKRVYLARGGMLIDATGTRRRLQALAVLGWTAAAIGERMGDLSARHVQTLITRELVHRRTAAQVAAVYEQLSGTPGGSSITRSRAVAKGWAPPLGWDEGQIDDPAAVSHTEIEAAHAEALRMHDLWRKRIGKAAQFARIQQNPDQYADYLARRRETNRLSKQRSRAKAAA